MNKALQTSNNTIEALLSNDQRRCIGLEKTIKELSDFLYKNYDEEFFEKVLYQNKELNYKNYNITFSHYEKTLNRLYEKLRALEELGYATDYYLKETVKKYTEEINNSIKEMTALYSQFRNKDFRVVSVPIRQSFNYLNYNKENLPLCAIVNGRLTMSGINSEPVVIKKATKIESSVETYRDNLKEYQDTKMYRTFYMFKDALDAVSYIKTNVYASGGTGSATDPYVLELYHDYRDGSEVGPYKIWTFDFDKEPYKAWSKDSSGDILPATVNNNTVIVKEFETNTQIEVDMFSSGRSIIINPPGTGYERNKKYSISVTTGVDTPGGSLASRDLLMKVFNIVDENGSMKGDVGPFKQWSIDLNAEADPNTVNINTVWVEGRKNNNRKITTHIYTKGKEIIIDPPAKGYESGEDYRIVITDKIKSLETGQSLSGRITKQFRIDNNDLKLEWMAAGDHVKLQDKNGKWHHFMIAEKDNFALLIEKDYVDGGKMINVKQFRESFPENIVYHENKEYEVSNYENLLMDLSETSIGFNQIALDSGQSIEAVMFNNATGLDL